MSKKTESILIINGHPHVGDHYVTALADAYERGAREAGFKVDRIDVAKLNVTPLQDPAEFYEASDDPLTLDGQAKITAADHVVLLFPMWFGGLPAYTRAYIERLGGGGFFLSESEETEWPKAMMKGKSVRIVMTMGMPSAAYRMIFGSFSLRGLERSIFGISGFHPIRHTLIGMVEDMKDEGRRNWLSKMEEMGRLGR